jgi:YidC/Oxa1 family membrane protein insertase
MSFYTLLDPLVRVGYWTLSGIARVLPGPTGGTALAISIVLLTVAVRACLIPAALAAQRAGRAQAALAPELARLRRRYGRDRAALAAQTAAAYRQAGVSPFAGLRPALVQLVALSTVYRIIVVPTIAGQANAILDATVLGAPLAGHWPAVLGTAGLTSAPAAAFGVLLLALLALAWFSARQTARQPTTGPVSAPGQPGSGTVRRLVRLLPYGTVAFATIAPVAVGCYLLTTTTWTLAERAVLPHLG